MIDAKIYVADLAAYNNGFLHGVWINASSDANEMDALVQEMLAKSPVPDAEEYAIHDHDGIKVSEHTSLSEVAEIVTKMETLEKHLGDQVEEIFEAFEECFGECDDVQNIIDAYCGQYDSERDYAEQLADDLGYLDQMPENLRHYFDYDAFARDLFINDLVMSDTRHVFNRNW